jgi:hypothetical protein
MYSQKWSVRGVDPQSVEKLLEVKKICGESLGQLLNESIEFWYDSLEPVDVESEADILQPQVGQNLTHLKNDAASPSLGNDKL